MIRSRPFKIMIVDDDDDMTTLLKTWISNKWGEEVNFKIFDSSELALLFLEEDVEDKEEIHLCLVDISLQEGDGIDLIRTGLRYSKFTKFVAMSVDGKASRALEAYHAGADYFLKKPIGKKECEEVLEHCLDYFNHWAKLLSE